MIKSWNLLPLLFITCCSSLAEEAPAKKEPYDPARFVSTEGKVIFVPLNDPKFLKAAEASYLEDEDFVLGVEVDAEARAYPIRFIAFHHVVNDRIGGKPVTLTY